MTSHLIPTPTVDRNGRQTTVLRKPVEAAAASVALSNAAPSLGPVVASAERPATRLVLPNPMTVEELRDLGAKYRGLNTVSTQEISGLYPTKTPLEEYAPLESWALIRRICDKGIDPEVPAILVMTFNNRVNSWWLNSEEYAKTQLNSSLLVLEAIYAKYPEVRLWSPELEAQTISRGLEAYGYSEDTDECRVLEPIDSEEKLEQATAVIAFLFNAEFNHGGLMGRTVTNRSYVDSDGNSRFGTTITNRSVDAYLREHPTSFPLIKEYMENRELGPSHEDAQHLFAYIEDTSTVPAVSEGWL